MAPNSRQNYQNRKTAKVMILKILNIIILSVYVKVRISEFKLKKIKFFTKLKLKKNKHIDIKL